MKNNFNSDNYDCSNNYSSDGIGTETNSKGIEMNNMDRINNILKVMSSKSYDGMIITQFNNIKYLSNYSPSSFAICLLKEDPIIFTTAMDKELAENKSILPVKEFKSISDLKNVFKEEKLGKIAVERNLPIASYKRLKADKSKNESWDLSIENFLEESRMIKSQDELNNIRKATEIAHKSFLEIDIREKQEENVKDWEIAYELGYLMRTNGASEESFETIVATGPNTSLPHARCENKKLGSIVLMDWGSKYNGYCSDTSRTIIDERDEKQKEIFDIVIEAYNSAIAGIKPGIRACDIDKIARSIIQDYGYGDNFIHATGHSLGLDIHENPSISKKDETILEENMVITIEPGIYLEGKFGVRIEDTLIVGKNKATVIGNLPYDI